MTKNNDLSAQAKQLGEQALKLANTARVEAGRYAQENIGKLDSAIDKATAAVERKTGKDHHGTASKVKDAAAKGAAYLASDSGAPADRSGAGRGPGAVAGPQDQVRPAATWPDAPGSTGGRADMPTIPTGPLSDLPGDQPDQPGDVPGRHRDAGGGI